MERHTYICSSITVYSRCSSSAGMPRHEAVSSNCLLAAQASSLLISVSTRAESLSAKSSAKHLRSRCFFLPFSPRLHRFQTANAARRCFTATVFSLTTRTEVMPLKQSLRVHVNLPQISICHFMLKEESSRETGSRSSTTIRAPGSSCAARSAALG